MPRQSSIKRAIRALEHERERYDRRGAMGQFGAWQERQMILAAIAAAERLAGQPSTPRQEVQRERHPRAYGSAAHMGRVALAIRETMLHLVAHHQWNGAPSRLGPELPCSARGGPSGYAIGGGPPRTSLAATVSRRGVARSDCSELRRVRLLCMARQICSTRRRLQPSAARPETSTPNTFLKDHHRRRSAMAPACEASIARMFVCDEAKRHRHGWPPLSEATLAHKVTEHADFSETGGLPIHRRNFATDRLPDPVRVPQ